MNSYLEFLMQIVICFYLVLVLVSKDNIGEDQLVLERLFWLVQALFLFVRFSFAFPGSDMTRVAAQVVAGIGFLGAGVIIKDGKTVKGLTTAATLWCAAAIGILCSAGLLVEAAIGTLFILFTNIILRGVNSKINHLSGHINYDLYYFSIIVEENKEKDIIKILKSIVKDNSSFINSIIVNDTENGNIKIDISIGIDSDKKNISNDIMQKLLNRNDVVSISLDKKDKRFLFEDEEL